MSARRIAVVFERNQVDDTFGFGVALSNRTTASIDSADSLLRTALSEHGEMWDATELRLNGEQFDPPVEVATANVIRFGTTWRLDGLTFVHELREIGDESQIIVVEKIGKKALREDAAARPNSQLR
jgi:hypothetical protein